MTLSRRHRRARRGLAMLAEAAAETRSFAAAPDRIVELDDWIERTARLQIAPPSAQDAIPLPPNGTCPHGWTRSGSFCLRNGSGR